MGRGLAYKRHQKEKRKKKSFKRYLNNWHDIVMWGRERAEEFAKYFSHYADNQKSCSCWMCGNPRRQKFAKKEQITLQEKIQDEKDAELEQDYEEFDKTFYEMYEDIDKDDPGEGIHTKIK
jgi:hypothetical protein